MTDNVVPWGGITRLPVPSEQILQAALDTGLSEVLVIGIDKDGGEYFAASNADGGANVWHLERAKFKLMVIADELANDPQRS